MPAPTVNVHVHLHKRLGPGGRCLYWLTCSACGTNGPAWSRSAAERDLHAHLTHHATARPVPDHWSPRLEGPMDPDSCLDRLLDAATSRDAAGLRQAASDLASWLDRGGFPPRDPRQHRRTSTRASRPNRHRRGRG